MNIVGEKYSNPKAREEVADFGFAMVRPDGLRLGLDEPIIDRIEANELSIVKRKLLILDDIHVDRVYSDLTERHFYPDLKKSLVGERVLAMLVGGEQVSKRLMEIKGTVWDYAGTVRGDYSLAHLLSGKELELFKSGTLTEKELDPDTAAEIMRYDRMHCEEDATGTRKAIHAIYTKEEVGEASARFSRLSHFLLNISQR